MPYGLRNAAQTFQPFMDIWYTYIDDVLIASKTSDDHKVHLRLVLECFASYGILINPAKCVLGVSNLHFHGHYVTSDGVSPLPEQVQVTYLRLSSTYLPS